MAIPEGKGRGGVQSVDGERRRFSGGDKGKDESEDGRRPSGRTGRPDSLHGSGVRVQPERGEKGCGEANGQGEGEHVQA